MIRIAVLFVAMFVGSLGLAAQKFTKSQLGKISKVKGHWRFMHKISDGQIVYDLTRSQNGHSATMMDTFTVHSYDVKNRKRRYNVVAPNSIGEYDNGYANENSKWSVQKISGGGLMVLVENAYYPGCPPLKRKLLQVGSGELQLQDMESNLIFVYKRITRAAYSSLMAPKQYSTPSEPQPKSKKPSVKRM